MTDMLVVVPSRGRPQNAADLREAWAETGTEAVLVLGLDLDDSTVGAYLVDHEQYRYDVGPMVGMCGTLNRLALQMAEHYDIIGFMGDDHRPRTPGWDLKITTALDELGTGIAYGNDLVHGEGLPTAVFMTADIVRALGYMAPPGLEHLFLDNAWKALGEALGAIRYLPDVIIEHMHPIAGKAEWDEGYKRVNTMSLQEKDGAEFLRWQRDDLPDAVAKIKAYVEGTTHQLDWRG